MNHIEFNIAIRQLGLTTTELAKVLGVSTRTTRRWADGSRRVNASLAILLKLLQAGYICLKDIEAVR